MITGTTRLAAVIGSPVRHSLSPALHNAAFAHRGVDAVYAAFEVAPGRAGAALDAMDTLGLLGLSVTMPHKDDVWAELTRRGRVDAHAAALRTVNTVARDADGSLVGYSTDGPGFVASMRVDAGWDPAGLRCAVLGAGGTARAIAVALAEAGATEVAVMARRAAAADAVVELLGAVGRVAPTSDLATMDVIVNATPVGMGDRAGDIPLDPSQLHPGQLVVDAVYHPLDTALLQAARSAGAATLDGLGMLVHQASLQQLHWTGLAGDPGVMRAAAQAELARRSATSGH
jgi:shikimate dehydrogenase